MPKPPVTIIKAGGKVLEDPISLNNYLQQLQKIKTPFILVHGGGTEASAMAKQLGIEQQMHEGRRITDEATLKIAVMCYAGWINKSLVAKLQSLGVNALGLCGADLNLVPAVKRAPVPVDFGWVGNPQPGTAQLQTLTQLLQMGIVPVFSAITHDTAGQLLNTNADTLAATLAMLLQADFETQLLLTFEKEGVLADAELSDSTLSQLNLQQFTELRALGKIKDGMIPKLENAFQVAQSGVRVRIGAALKINELMEQRTGTEVCTL